MKVMIFGGTVEGRVLAAERANAGDDVTACVTSEYARRLLDSSVNCIARPLDRVEMAAAIANESPECILDATHPFAVQVTENIRFCAAQAHIPYERICRPPSLNQDWAGDVEWVRDTEAAAQSLRSAAGNVLLTTGSHTLTQYVRAIPLERLYVRVLPTAKALALCCEQLALPPGHVVAMQGPFSRALNGAMYDQLAIRTMVSKDSGEPGGVSDKVIPALERDIHVIMIQRPRED